MVMVFVRWVVFFVWFLTRDSSVILVVYVLEVLQSGPPRLAPYRQCLATDVAVPLLLLLTMASIHLLLLLPSTYNVCNQDHGSYVCPPSRTRVAEGEHPSHGGNPYPVELCQKAISMWQNGEDTRASWLMQWCSTLPEETPLSPHVQKMYSSISSRRECSPKVGIRQCICNPWGSQAGPCESGAVLDGRSEGVHWWGAHQQSQLQPCNSPLLSVPNLQGRASTRSFSEGCLINFWLSVFTHQPLQESLQVLESIISSWYSRGEHKRSYWHWWAWVYGICSTLRTAALVGAVLIKF